MLEAVEVCLTAPSRDHWLWYIIEVNLSPAIMGIITTPTDLVISPTTSTDLSSMNISSMAV
jgi:hypothetical protein